VFHGKRGELVEQRNYQLRKNTHKLFNREKKTGEWTEYSRALTEYNKVLREAMNSFRRLEISLRERDCIEYWLRTL
jgi:hypothetical protein